MIDPCIPGSLSERVLANFCEFDCDHHFVMACGEGWFNPPCDSGPLFKWLEDIVLRPDAE